MGLPGVPSPWTGRAPLCLMPCVGMCPLVHRNGDVRPPQRRPGTLWGSGPPHAPSGSCPTPGPASHTGMVMSIPRIVPGMPTPWEGWPGLTCPPVPQSRWARTRRTDLGMAARPRQRRTGWTAWRGPKLLRVSSLPYRTMPCRAVLCQGAVLGPRAAGAAGGRGAQGSGAAVPMEGEDVRCRGQHCVCVVAPWPMRGCAGPAECRGVPVSSSSLTFPCRCGAEAEAGELPPW